MQNYLIISIVLLFFACAGNKTNTSVAKDDLGIKAIETIEKDGYKLEVYDFQSLRPLMYKTNSDTTFVINFWATWCKPCIEELPYFEELHANYKQKKVKVILISLDFPKKLESHLIPYILEHKLQAEILALIDPDSNAWISKVDETWSGAIPATLIYSKGSRGFYEQSFSDYVELENVLKKHR